MCPVADKPTNTPTPNQEQTLESGHPQGAQTINDILEGMMADVKSQGHDEVTLAGSFKECPECDFGEDEFQNDIPTPCKYHDGRYCKVCGGLTCSCE